MYTPNQLVAKNFLSFKELRYDFKQKQAVLIQGLNLTDEGSKSNGSGKSSLQEMIYFAYIGDTSRPISTKKLIRHGEDSADITLILNSKLNQLTIKRKLFLNKTSTLEIWLHGPCDGGKEVTFASVNDGNKLIREMVGITADDFKNFFLINRGNYRSFFNLSDNEKKAFIGRFSNADKIKMIYPVIEKEIRDIEHCIIGAKQKQAVIEGRIVSVEETIGQLEAQKDSIQNDVHIGNAITEIEHCEREQERIAEEIEELEKVSFRNEIKYWINRVEIFEKRSESLRKISYQYEHNYLEKARKENWEAHEKICAIQFNNDKEQALLKKAIMEIDNLLETAIECPECQHVFSLQDKTFDEEKVMEERQELQGTYEEIENDNKFCLGEKEYFESQLNAIKVEISGVNKKEERVRKLIFQSEWDRDGCELNIKKFKKAEADNETKIAVLMCDIELMDKEIENQKKLIKSLEDNVQTKQLDNLISLKERELESLENDLLQYSDEQEEQDLKLTAKKKWLLDFKKFYSYLSNHSLKVIEDRTNDFLEKMNTNLSVQIDGFKVLADNSLREQISVSVLRDGEIEGLANQFSQGEQARLEISIILACQSIINETAGIGKGLDLIFIDEVLDSLDSEGQKAMAKALSSVNKTIFVISHVEIEEVVDNNVLTIIKENKISSIK